MGDGSGSPRWHILTGEYPPQLGGVSDYCAQLAAGLAGAGGEVHIWAPEAEGPASAVPGVVVHREAGRWSPAGLAQLGEALDAFEAPRRLIVEYTPYAWGYKGLNVGFCRWLIRRHRAGDEVRVMFHEVCYPFRLRARPAHWLLAAGQRWMARLALAASSRVDISVPAWERVLLLYEPGPRRPMAWKPVPSNIPVIDDPEAVSALRRRLAPDGRLIIGSFGTFGSLIEESLAPALRALLDGQSGRVGLLMGRAGRAFADRLGAACPAIAGRLEATGGLDPAAISIHLQACDLLIQPYPDGVSSRRGSLMAGLSHGSAIVSTVGPSTDPIWAESGCLALAPVGDAGALVASAEALLADPTARARLGLTARSAYDRHFALDRTVSAILLEDAAGAEAVGS